MCGITGYFFREINSRKTPIVRMSASIAHRGPDDEGFLLADVVNCRSYTYSSNRSPAVVQKQWPLLHENDDIPQHNLAMSQVRYSIIDLSPGGHQPMWSMCGNFCITFNGEIYNFIELRAELQKTGVNFRTNSDTEVLLSGYITWGELVFQKLNGFFAIAIYDVKRKAVLLARDRIGKAHLYFSFKKNDSFFWASEIKALIAADVVSNNSIDSASIADYLIYGRRDRAGTFWHEAQDFPPGHFAWIDQSCNFVPQCYWKLPEFRLTSKDISLDEASIGLSQILTDALELRMRADVPVGFELSGGMDSSALVGLAAGKLHKPIKTYTIEFEEAHANEEPFARAVSQRYPQLIDYHVIRPEKEEFWGAADKFVRLQEEPFHSPNLYVNQRLRSQIKANGAHVVITGAAGDEMLAGYAKDYQGPFLRYLLSMGDYSSFKTELMANTEVKPMRAFKRMLLDSLLSQEQRAIHSKRASRELGFLKKILAPDVFHTTLNRPSTRAENTFHGRTIANMTYKMMNYWLRSGAKSDYGIPIESRAPFLDYRVVEYCTTLPPEYLIHNGWHKYVLRKAVEPFVPAEVVWRRNKMGFPFPYCEWLLKTKPTAIKNITDVECPYISIVALTENYDRMAQVASVALWRLLSMLLWWRVMVEKRSISM